MGRVSCRELTRVEGEELPDADVCCGALPFALPDSCAVVTDWQAFPTRWRRHSGGGMERLYFYATVSQSYVLRRFHKFCSVCVCL